MGAPYGPCATKLLSFLLLAEPPSLGQTGAKLFGALFVALDALFFVSFLSSFFDVVFYLLSEPLGVDFELPNRPSDPQKC